LQPSTAHSRRTWGSLLDREIEFKTILQPPRLSPTGTGRGEESGAACVVACASATVGL